MNKLRLCIIALAACAVSACATLGAIGTAVDVLGTPSTAVSATSDKVVLEGTRALTLANYAYAGAANAAVPFVRNKRLPPATVDRIEQLSNRANDLLEKGDSGLTLAQRAAAVFAIADQLNALIGK